jgi:hypothetical protein
MRAARNTGDLSVKPSDWKVHWRGRGADRAALY